MSKSYDNYIANDSSKDIFGKVMSISDDAVELLSFVLLKSRMRLVNCRPFIRWNRRKAWLVN